LCWPSHKRLQFADISEPLRKVCPIDQHTDHLPSLKVIAQEVRVALVDFLEAADSRRGVGEGLVRRRLGITGRKECLTMPSLRAAMRYSELRFPGALHASYHHVKSPRRGYSIANSAGAPRSVA
jgi:hypothetical protein